MTMQWRVAPGHPNHIVSDEGHVRHRRVNAPLLTGYIDQDGYRIVRLDGMARRVHRIVCEAFHGPPPPDTECAHFDGNPVNNSAANLRWATHKENVADSIRAGTFNRLSGGGQAHPCARLSDQQIETIREMAAAGVSQRKIAAQFGIVQSHVCRVVSGKRRPTSTSIPIPNNQEQEPE